MREKHFATAFIILTLLISTGVMISSGRAAGDPDERFKGYNLEKENWTTGNLGKDYFEGGFVSYLLRISKDSKLWDAPSFDISYNFHQDSSDAVYIDGFDTSISPTGFQYAPDAGYLPDDQQDTSLSLDTWYNIPVPEADGVPDPSTGIFIDNYMDAWPVGEPEVADERYFTITNIPWGDATDHMFFFFRAHLALDIIWWNGFEEDIPIPLDGDEFQSYGIGSGVLHGASFATGSSRHFYLQVPGVGAKTIPIPIAQYPDTLINGHKYKDEDPNFGPLGTNTPIDNWAINLTAELDLFGPYTLPYRPPLAYTGTGGWDPGYFEFTGLIGGSFNLTEEDRAGYTHSYIDHVGEGTDHNPNLEHGWITFLLEGGKTETVDFYNVLLGSISGHKYNDTDGDGFGGLDDPIEGWTINLYESDGAGGWDLVGSTLTDALGYYEFTNLFPGEYNVTEGLWPGWIHIDPESGYILVALDPGEDDENNNFYNFELGTKGGFKLEDLTGDGETADDTALSGWTINLFESPDWVNPVDTTTTDGSGYYVFSGLEAGTYRVNETLPDGWIQTSPVSPSYHEFTVVSGFEDLNNNFTNFELGTKGGYKLEDLTGDGETADDTPLSGWDIDLYRWDGAVWVLNDSDTTDGSGYYEFTGLGPGDYRVSEWIFSGWIQTSPVSPYHHYFTVTSGFSDLNNNFTNFELGTKGGFKFNDTTGDGLSEDDEPLNGWTIQLRNVTDDNNIIATAITGDDAKGWADGYYEFNDLLPGEYNVTEVLQAGWICTSDPCFHEFTVISGFEELNNNFTNFELVSISGYKWNDEDGNATWDASEPALEGWTIELYRWEGGVWVFNNSDVTDATGYYEFTDLGPGKYNVTEIEEDRWVQSYPESDGDHVIDVVSGQVYENNDFGNFHPKIELTVCTTYDSDREEVTYVLTVKNPLPTGGSPLTDLTLVKVDGHTIPGETNPLLGTFATLSAGEDQSSAPYTYTFTVTDTSPFEVTFTASGYDVDLDLVSVDITVSVTFP